MAIVVGSVAVDVVPSAERFSERLRAQIGNLPTIRLDLDTSEAEAKIENLRRRLAEMTNAHVRVDVDTAGAMAQIAALQARLDALQDRSINVNVNGSDRAQSSVSGIGNAGIGSQLKVAAMTAGIITGIAAIIPIAAAATAAIAGIGVGAAAGVAGLLVGKLALGGVGAALQAGNQPNSGGATPQSGIQLTNAQLGVESQQIAAKQATQSAADQLSQALQAQRDAEVALASAQFNAIQAQKDLTLARVAAKQSLEDLSNQVIDNGLAQQQAALTLAAARRSLDIANANPDSKNALNAAALAGIQLAFDQAKQQSAELQLTGERLAAQKAAADKAGVAGSAGVVTAQQKVIDTTTALAKAHVTVTDTAHKVAEAQVNVTDTTQKNAIAQQQAADALKQAALAASGALGAFAQAMSKLNPVQQQFVQFLRSIKPELDGLKAAASNSFLPLLEQAIKIVLPMLPALEKILSTVGTAFGQMAVSAATALNGPFWQQFLTFLNSTLGPDIKTLGAILGNLFRAGAAAWEAFQPVIAQIGTVFTNLTSNLAASFSGGGLTGIVTFIQQTLPAVGQALSSVGGAFLAVVQAFAPAAGPALGIVKLLADELAKLAPIISPLITFFVRLLQAALAPLAPILTRLVTELIPPLESLLLALAPIIPLIANAIVNLVVAFLPLVPLFAQLVGSLLPPLIGFIQVLISQGIVPLVTALVTGLAPVLPIMVKNFQDLLTALTPLIPPLVNVFVVALKALLPVLPELDTALVKMAIALVQILVAIAPVLPPMIQLMTQIWTRPMVTLIIDLANAITSILNAILAVGKAIGPAFATISNAWSSFWDGLKTIVDNIFGPIEQSIKNVVNAVIDAVDFMIRALNNLHVHIPAIKVLGVGTPSVDVGFNIPEIPHLAAGGIVPATQGGVLALLGEGGLDEAVVPLENGRPKGNKFGGMTNHFTLNEVTDTVGTSNALMRRLAFLAG